MSYNTLQPIESGGTNAITAAQARTNLGLGSASDVTFGNLTLAAGGALRTSTSAGNTLLLQAYDTDTGPAYVTMITLTAGTAPTCLIRPQDGTASAPPYSFGSETNMGFFRAGAQSTGWCTFGAQFMSFNNSAMQSVNTNQWFLAYSATVALPTYSFVGDPDTGWLRSNANEMTASCGNLAQMVIANNGGQYRGKNTNTAAPIGYIGEIILGSRVPGSALALTNTVAANLTSISLTAGNWLVFGSTSFTGSPTGTTLVGSINTVSATTAFPAHSQSPTMPNANSDNDLCIPPLTLSLSATTTVYLVAQANFTGGAVSSYGEITAVRIG